jgi:4-hydroxybenzoate polyprenyltransferase
VWSNCLAGWWLGGSGDPRRLPLLFAATTLLYLGGMIRNRAFEGGFQGQVGSASPAAGPASEGWSLGLLALGAVGMAWLGKATGGLGVGLALLIVGAQAIPWREPKSILLPGICRLIVCLTAASAAQDGITAHAIACGLALAGYVAGVGWFARQADVTGPARYGPMLLLVGPILVALVADSGGRREDGLLLAAVLALWSARCLRPALWSAERDFAGAVSGLVAGIVFVDLLAASDGPKALSLVFLLLFGATRLLQIRLPEATSAR